MSRDTVLKTLKPLTQGWVVDSEPLGAKSRAAIDFGGGLNVDVKLVHVEPDATYTIGLNVYGEDVPVLGGLKRIAFDAGPLTIDGVSKTNINQFELGTVETNAKGKVKSRFTLPVKSGTYDMQVWAAKGRNGSGPAVCFKSGTTFGDSDHVRAYDPESCEKSLLSFVVTGCGRSGTAFASRVLSLLGFPCGHEKTFGVKAVRTGNIEFLRPGPDVWGDSSHMAVPFVSGFPRNALVLHQVRNPVKVVRSLVGIGFLSPSFAAPVLKHLPQITADDSLLVKSMKYWVYWNELVETECADRDVRYHRYRVKDLGRLETGALAEVVGLLGRERSPEEYERAVGAVAKNINSRRRDQSVTWAALPEGDLKDRMAEAAQRYGYSRAELEDA